MTDKEKIENNIRMAEGFISEAKRCLSEEYDHYADVKKCSGTVTLDIDEVAKGVWPESYEITCELRENPDALMRILSRSMRFDRKTLRRLFHSVTHRQQVWFDVVIEFCDGTVDEGGFVAKTPHQLRFLLNKIHHIRTRYKISDRED